MSRSYLVKKFVWNAFQSFFKFVSSSFQIHFKSTAGSLIFRTFFINLLLLQFSVGFKFALEANKFTLKWAKFGNDPWNGKKYLCKGENNHFLKDLPTVSNFEVENSIFSQQPQHEMKIKFINLKNSLVLGNDWERAIMIRSFVCRLWVGVFTRFWFRLLIFYSTSDTFNDLL